MSLKNIEKLRKNNELIEIIEDILIDAKKGIIVSAAIGFVRSDSKTGNVFTSSYPVQLIGELTCLQREIIDSTVDIRLHKSGEEY